jgi:hypothetical protein
MQTVILQVRLKIRLLAHIFTEMLDSVRSPVEVIENSKFHFEQPDLTPKEKRKKKKNQRKGSGSIRTTLELTSPPNEEPSAEEPVAEEDAAAEPAAEEPAGESLVQSCSRIQVSAKHLMFSSPVSKKYLPAVGKKAFITCKKAQLKSLQKAGILRHS